MAHKRGKKAVPTVARSMEASCEDVPWKQGTHKLNVGRYLDEHDPKAEPPSRFCGKLFDPQKTVLAAMLELEADPSIWVGLKTAEKVTTAFAAVGDPPSFGKTAVMLALLCSDHWPKKLPMSETLFSIPMSGKTLDYGFVMRVSLTGPKMDQVSLPVVTTRYSRVLDTTLVIAASAVLSHWEEEIKKFTPGLRYFVVHEVRSLKELNRLFTSGEINFYEVILVKAGTVTTSFSIEGEKIFPSLKSRSILEAIAAIIDGYTFKRLVIDDYDTLPLTYMDSILPALFTWLVSATIRQTNVEARRAIGTADFYEACRGSRMTNVPVVSLAKEAFVNTTLTLCCHPDYVTDFINSTAIKFRRIFVPGGFKKMLDILGVTPEVTEMLHAGAVESAARALNICATKPEDIIRHLIGQKMSRLADICKELERGGDSKKLLEEKKRITDTLDRVRDNVREGHCQCCMVPFETGKEAAYLFVGCCHIIVCEPCVIDVHKKTFISRCPNCQKQIKSVASHLIRVGPELDIEKAIKDENILACQLTPDFVVEPAVEALEVDIILEQLQCFKFKALMQLLRIELYGAPPESLECINDKETPSYVKGLLSGKRNIPWPKTSQKKILVFTMHSESTKNIVLLLNAAKIPHLVLQGTRKQKDSSIATFRESPHLHVMILTSAKDCGGIDMPYISHVVFFHVVIDKNVEKQVAGRGQRQGRFANLEIVTIVNEDEAEHID